MTRVSLPAAGLAALLLLGAAQMAAGPARAADPLVTLSASTQVEADESLVWNADYVLRNLAGVGFYPDSMLIDFVDEDPGVTGLPRRWSEPFNALIAALPPLSAGDSTQASLSIPARFERGSLTLRMYGHSPAGSTVVPPVTVKLLPGPASIAWPSRQLAVGKRSVELILMAPADPAGKAPGLLFVPGHGDHARRWLSQALGVHKRGYAIAIVSLPGYGTSQGPADLGGPASLAALEAALAALAKTPGVDPARLAIVGADRGATAAALLAARHPEVKALALASASYDLWAEWRAGDAAARGTIVAQAGKDSAGWKARSPLSQPLPRCPVLILHGLQDTQAPLAAAQAYAAALRAAGVTVDEQLQKGRGHDLSTIAIRSNLNRFLKGCFGI